jgi:prepilin signal peptidase PulO-like enzyme (type II secretory pathway)
MENNIPHFFKEIKSRAKLQIKPFNDLYFTYLIVFVLIIGGVGIWITLIQELNNEKFNYLQFVLNIGTYYLVLITTSYIDITTNEKIVNKKSLHIYSFILLLIIIGIFSISFFLSQSYSIIIAFFGLIISLFVWHLANCDNEKFMDESYMAKIKSEASNTHGSNW